MYTPVVNLHLNISSKIYNTKHHKRNNYILCEYVSTCSSSGMISFQNKLNGVVFQ